VLCCRDLTPIDEIGGIQRGTWQIVSSAVMNPLKGVTDLVAEPYKHYQAEQSWKSTWEGTWKGVKSLVQSPLIVAKDAIDGTKKIVQGVMETPEMVTNWKNGLTFNEFMGWTFGYPVKGLEQFPGEVGDILCIQQTMSVHYVLKIDDNTVFHPLGPNCDDDNLYDAQESSDEEEDEEDELGDELSTSKLKYIKKQFSSATLTVIDAKYCIVQNPVENVAFIFKAVEGEQVIKNATDEEKKYAPCRSCEHFCFLSRYGVNFEVENEK